MLIPIVDFYVMYRMYKIYIDSIMCVYGSIQAIKSHYDPKIDRVQALCFEQKINNKES